MSDYVIDTFDLPGGLQGEIIIDQDGDACNPRDWDGNYTDLVLSHRRYDWPNDLDVDFDEFNDWDEVRDHICKTHDVRVILPVSVYDHSGVRLYVGHPPCPWDSGYVGFAVVRAERIREIQGIKRITEKYVKMAEEAAVEEVDTYNAWCSGDVYGWVVTDPETEEQIDACWGYVGDDEFSYMKECAREAAEAHVGRHLDKTLSGV